MKFFKPQVQLIRRTIMDEAPAYLIHVVTFCDRTNYQADGYEALANNLNAEGEYEVHLNIIQKEDLPDLSYITPVTHSINLGQLPFGSGNGTITIKAFVSELIASRGDNEKGKTKVETTDPDEEDRPMGEVLECPIFKFK